MKRKYIIFSDTIRAYKALTAEKPATGPEKPAELAPAYIVRTLPQKATSKPHKPTRKARRRGSYFVKTPAGIIPRAGWIFNICGLDIGAAKNGAEWIITDIKTGLAAGSVKKLDEVPRKVEALEKAIKEIHATENAQKLIREIETAYDAAV